MKKFLFMLLTILCFSTFACPLEEHIANHYITVYVTGYNYTRAQAEAVISNVNDIRISALTAGMSLDTVETLTTAIMETGDPLTTTSNEALVNGLTTAQQNATNQGFGSLSVDSVSASGNGLNISMSATSADGNSTTTAQVNTSSSVPTYSTTGTTSTASNQTATNTSQALYRPSDSNRPVATSSSTTDISTGKSVRIIGGVRVVSNGEGGSILTDGTIKGN